MAKSKKKPAAKPVKKVVTKAKSAAKANKAVKRSQHPRKLLPKNLHRNPL